MMLAAAIAANAWANLTPITIAVSHTRLVRFQIPPSIGPSDDGGFEDLRIVDDTGAEVPYAIDPTLRGDDRRDVELIDTGFVRGSGTQAVADLGTGGDLENGITLLTDTSRLPTYFEHVALDASDDRKTWRTIRTDALIYRVDQDAGNGNQTIWFPATRSRWLRVRIEDGHASFPLTGASVAANAGSVPALVPLPNVPAPSSASEPNAQTWRVDSAVTLRPSAVSFAVGPGTFSRPVTIASSDDGTIWNDLGSDTIARYSDGSEHLSFAFSERTTKHIRITVDDGNDAPLAGVRPALLEHPHSVVFAAQPDRSYHILSGNADASAPSYDLGERLAHSTWTASDGTPGATAANPSYADRRTPFERYPWLLTALICGIAAVLAFLAIRTIRAPEPAS